MAGIANLVRQLGTMIGLGERPNSAIESSGARVVGKPWTCVEHAFLQ